MGSRALEKFARLPATDLALLGRSVAMLGTARVALWLFHFTTVRRLLAPSRRSLPARPATPERIGWAIAVAKRVVPGANCLPQAVVAEALLVARGHPAELRIGVIKTARGGLEAHAWVESAGRMVVGELSQGLTGYTVLPPLPGVGR
jgi:hypothetical protein